MRVALNVAISLAVFAAAFTLFRLTKVLASSSALVDWALILAASALAVYLSQPLTALRSLILFLGTAAPAFLILFIIVYTVFGDSL